MGDFLVSQIRTYAVESELTLVITAALAGLYYLIVRLLAEWKPFFGNLLGVNKAPEYGLEKAA